MILAPPAAQPIVLAACASAGAPGSQQTTPTGTPYNPVEVIVRNVVNAVSPLLQTAAQGSQWLSLPLGTPAGALETGVPPVPLFPEPAQATTAASLAASAGWVGPMATVLPLGLLSGLTQALTASTARLAAVTAGITTGAPFQFQPLPLVESAVISAISAAFNSDPVFGIGDPSRRIPLASVCARATAAVWAAVRPVAPVTVGVLPGVIPPAPLPVVVL